MHECKYVECNGWRFLCLYKEDRARAFKNALQNLQYSLKSLQFLIFAGNSLKIMAAERCLVQVEHKALEQHWNGDA